MARVFDGSTSNYFAAAGLKYDIPANFSVVWRAKTSSDTDQAVLGRRDSSGAGGFVVSRNAAFNAVAATAFGVADIFGSTAFNSWPADGAYHSFILTKSGTSWTLYVDSTTAVGTATSSYTSTAGPDLYVGAYNNAAGAGVTDPFNGSLYDVALFPGVLGSTDRSNFLGGTAPSGLTAAGTDHYWPLDNAAAGNESDSFGSATLTEVGTVTYESTVVAPVITGPSGAAGAATSTTNIAENATTGPTFSTSAALGGGYPTLTGAQAANWTLTALTSTSWRADPVVPFDFEAGGLVNPQTIVFNADAATSQTCTVTITNASEPPLAPTIGTATAGNASASVAFTPPSNTGRPAITGYTATSSPGGLTGTGASSPITVSGLTNGTAYTFTVAATNADGTGPASAASNSVTPSAGVSAGSFNLNNAIYTFKRKDNVVLASLGVTFFVNNHLTGELIGAAITGLSTNASGIVTTPVSNASVVAGATYRLSWRFSSGEYGQIEMQAA